MSSPADAAPVAIDVAPLLDRRYAEWDLASAPGNYASLVAGQVTNSALALVTLWIATRVLGPSGYGQLVAIIAAGQSIAQLAIHWSAPSLVRYGCEEFIDTGRVATAFWTRLALVGAAVAVVFATTPLWFPPLAALLALPDAARTELLAYVTGAALSVHLQFALQAAKLPRVLARLLTLERIIVAAMIAGCWAGHFSSPRAIMAAYIVAPLAMSAAAVWRLRDLLSRRPSIDRAVLGRMLRFSWPLLPAAFVGYFTTNFFDAFFITHYLSVAELGRYNVAFQIAGTAMQLPLWLGSIVLPLFVTLNARGGESTVVELLEDVLPMLALGWSIACAMAAAVGGVLLPVVFGSSFAGASRLLWPLFAAAALAGPVLIAYTALVNANARTHVAVVSALAAATVNIVLDFVLIPRWGLRGCAWATLAAYAASLAVSVWLVDERPWPSRIRVVEATLPAVLGAIAALWTEGSVTAIVVALASAAAIALGRRARLVAGTALLRQYS